MLHILTVSSITRMCPLWHFCLCFLLHVCLSFLFACSSVFSIACFPVSSIAYLSVSSIACISVFSSACLSSVSSNACFSVSSIACLSSVFSIACLSVSVFYCMFVVCVYSQEASWQLVFNPYTPKSTKSRNSNSSVQLRFFSSFLFVFVPGEPEKSKFLDLVDFGDVTFSVETVVEEEATNIQ